MTRIIIAAIAVLLAMMLYVAGIALSWYGTHLGPGTPTDTAIPSGVLQAISERQRAGAVDVGVQKPRQILFGDFHVHTSFSADAFMMSLPMIQGEGAHPVADACDFARYCSALDFWSANDHAEGVTPRRWLETKDAIRQCNAVAGDRDDPDVVAYLGWEWSQVGMTRETHFGHKNVVLRDLADDEVPARPIGAGGFVSRILVNHAMKNRLQWPLFDLANRQRYYDYDRFLRDISDAPVCASDVDVHDLGSDCMEEATTPAVLFRKLREWGSAAVVIPHGTAWGAYTPAGATWDQQLVGDQHDPDLQTMVEVFSGHGNSEEYRAWQAVEIQADGSMACPAPADGFTPSCWRAGEIIRERCSAAGIEDGECERRAGKARDGYVAAGMFGSFTIPGAGGEEWLDAGQCPDCFMPAYNLRPGSSTQYMAALGNFENPGRPRRFRFGYIASSDNHSSRPGNGYKEFARGSMTEARGAPRDEAWARRLIPDIGEPAPEAVPFDPDKFTFGPFLPGEVERWSSYLSTGGLVATHSAGRSRNAIWSAIERREVYGTSGDRILLWFDLINDASADGDIRPMGSETAMDQIPRFRVRAVGAFKQAPGCPDHVLSALSTQRVEDLCRGECYNPSDDRKLITRIEIVRIRPQMRPEEPVAALIQDPWRVFQCDLDPAGCEVEFEDDDFVPGQRDSVYYARAIEEPSAAINGENLRCEYDSEGNCIRINPCWADGRTPPDDDCLGVTEERAWSSPIYVDYPAE